MPFKIAHRKESDVPQPSRRGRPNPDLDQIKGEMAKLARGMVLEIETGSAGAVRRTKVLITKASKELGRKFQHWHLGTKVFTRQVDAVRRRGRPRRRP